MSIHTHSPADTLRTQAAPIRRRSLMTLAGLGLLSPTILSACSSRSGKASSSGTGGHIDTLRVHVPTTLAYMAPMTLFGQQGKLAPTIGKATVENWSSIDAMRTLLLQKQTDLAATPSYAAANLFNKGVPLRLVAMQVWGMLYVVGPKGSSAQGLQAMRGKTVAVPMPNNMPDLVFRCSARRAGTRVRTWRSRTTPTARRPCPTCWRATPSSRSCPSTRPAPDWPRPSSRARPWSGRPTSSRCGQR